MTAPDRSAGTPDVAPDLATEPLPPDTVGLLEGLTTTRAIRRYLDDPIPPDALRAILFAATRAPTGHNRQPFRFMVLEDGPKARAAKHLMGEGARRMWEVIRKNENYRPDEDTPKARIQRTMQHFVDHFEETPVVVLCCVLKQESEGSAEGDQDRMASMQVGPAIQNLLLAARGLGFGGVYTGWHAVVEAQLRELLRIPDDVVMHGTITLGKPAGKQGPVRRHPLGDLVFGEQWEETPAWAVDPPGTRWVSKHTLKPALNMDEIREIGRSFS
jgi:nitroreductase